MRNARSIRNDKIRKDIDEMIKDSKPGDIIFSDEISRALSLKRRSVSVRTVASLIRERDDVVSRDGKMHTWVKQSTTHG